MRILASLRVTYCDPLLLAYPHILLTCGPFIGFVGFFPVSQGYSCVGVDRHDDYSDDSSTSLAQCGFVGGFLPNFAIFALVSVHLGKFGLSSLASIGNSNAFLCQLSLPIHLYLSPLVSSFGGQSCSPPSLVDSVLFALGALLLWQRCCLFFSSYCYGCCQLLLRLLGVFLLLVLVHLQFPLGVLRLAAALLGFPCWLLFSEWQTVREALLFLLCPGGCRRFIGVRGVGSFFWAFGFQEVGAVSFRTLSGGSLSLHWQAWRGRGAETGL